jgi:hypothetical protein
MERQLDFEEYERHSADFRKAMREALEAKRRYRVVDDHIEEADETEREDS